MNIFDEIMANAGATTRANSTDFKTQFNKSDVTLVARKSACVKLGVETLNSYHFATQTDAKNAVQKLANELGQAFTLDGVEIAPSETDESE